MRGLFAWLLFLLAHAAAGEGTFDLQGFLDAALAKGEKRIVVPPGRYRVTPQHARHLYLHDLEGVEIVADGVEMICTETTLALAMERCRRLTLRGLTVDYDPLPFTEGRITALAEDKSWLEFTILSGYPDEKLEQRIEIFDPATRELRRETTSWQEFEPLGEHRYRVAKHGGYRFDPHIDTEQLGDILVTNHVHAPGGSAGHAITSSDCTDLVLENVTVYASNCFGFLEHRDDGSIYRRCRVDRRAAADDPVAREFPRMRSLDADAFHSVSALRGPALLGCTARFQGDDCVNIHGTYHFVTAADGETLRVLANGRLDLEPGAPVEFLPFTGPRPADAVVVKIEPAAPPTPEEKAFFQPLHMNQRLHDNFVEGKADAYRVTLDRAVKLPMGSMICSGARIGNGFRVEDCEFGFNRSRGILIKASHGALRRNRIEGSWMAAILIAPEFWWMEAASANDLVIEDNEISRCRGTAIQIEATGGDGHALPAGAHRDLTLRHNRVSASGWPAIHAGSTENLVLEGSVLPATDAPAARLRPWNWKGAEPQPVLLEMCGGVRE